MPRLPMIAGTNAQRMMTDVFAGYNHNLKISDGEFYDTQNLTTAEFPMLASRPKRGELTGNGGHVFHGLRAIIKKDGLYWVETETINGAEVGVLYANGRRIDPTGVHAFRLQTEKETQLVSMGAYICIFPDGKYFNTMDDTDYGDMGEDFTLSNVPVSYSMCHMDGTIYDPGGQHTSKQSSAPAEPANGDIWIDTTENAVKIWSSFTEMWTVIETVYTRVQFNTMGVIPQHFKEHDGVQISGLLFDDLNGSKIIYAVGGDENTEADYIVLVGILELNTSANATVNIRRVIPQLDYVCEAQNRLWGCYYGNIPYKGNINEIYCCALGDFKNWEQYLGVSTDSWRASCGSDGRWTGCINYLGSPTFFKENRIHPVSVSSVGAHQVGDLPARGVQEGSHKSLAIVNETLYYKTRAGIAAWQGGIPVDVGAALGDVRYYDAAAGVFGQRYYISMRDEENVWNLFCYDVKAGLWMREDNLHAEGWTSWGDELYAKSGNSIITINGTEGTLESRVHWYAETGVMYYELSDHKYVSRYNLRLKMERGAWVRLYIEYDNSGKWEFSGEVKVLRLDSFVVPVRPRRCDHLRLRIEGEGEVRIFSITRLIEKGSDM